MIRTYSELSQLASFKERFAYLQLNGAVGSETFGFDRWLNQKFYRSREWKRLRDEIIIRDNGCDLGIEGFEIRGRIYIHHMNPILQKDILDQTDLLLNSDFLICCTHETHNAIHYGDDSFISSLEPVVRTRNDTCPWRM